MNVLTGWLTGCNSELFEKQSKLWKHGMALTLPFRPQINTEILQKYQSWQFWMILSRNRGGGVGCRFGGGGGSMPLFYQTLLSQTCHLTWQNKQWQTTSYYQKQHIWRWGSNRLWSPVCILSFKWLLTVVMVGLSVPASCEITLFHLSSFI